MAYALPETAPEIVLFALMITCLVAAIVLLVAAFRAKTNKDTLGVGAGVLAGLSAVFLSVFLTYREKAYEDIVATANLVEKYAMVNLLIRDRAIENWQLYALGSGGNPLPIAPQSIYLELSKDEKFRGIVPYKLLNLVVGAQWREDEILDDLKKGKTDSQTKLTELKDLTDYVWQELCQWRKPLVEVSIPLNEECNIKQAQKVANQLSSSANQL